MGGQYPRYIGRTSSHDTLREIEVGFGRHSIQLHFIQFIFVAFGSARKKKMMVRPACIAFFAASFLLNGANGFVQQQSPHNGRGVSTTAIQGAGLPSFTGYDSFERLKKLTNVPSGEDQRKLRRTVYTHDDWKKHRNQDRFIVYLAAIFKSGVYKNLAGEVVLATAIATFICVYNALVGDWTDLTGVKHAGLIQSNFFPKLGLPLTAFTLTSPSLGLLLGK